MKVISHRGYENGQDAELENNIVQIKKLLNMNIDVEVDVLYNGGLYLGHDNPDYEINIGFLKQDGLWCHAKNIEALDIMLKNNIHCFWHQDDDYTITSKGFIWAYPGMKLTKNSVCVLPEHPINKEIDLKSCYGICTDYPFNYIKK